MAKFRKKPIVIEATQWHGRGDHPSVRMVPSLGITGQQLVGCDACEGQLYERHGFIETLEGKMRVCPGDWIITGVNGEKYPCKPDIFAATYDPVSDDDNA